jgi:hypothetical protein
MNGDEYRFTSRVEAVRWGRSRYTVIRVPEELAAAARAAGTRRVAGVIDDVAVNAAVNRAPVVDGPFVWAGATLLRRLEAEPGEPVRCALAPADPDAVDLPGDVRQALEDAGLVDAWEATSPAGRRRRLHAVESARRADTRARRIADLIAETAG